MNTHEKARFKHALKRCKGKQWSFEGVSELALQIIASVMRRKKGLTKRLQVMKDTAAHMLELNK